MTTHPDPQKKRFVFGCGNPLFGDDGFGPAVMEYLDGHYTLPEDTASLDVGTSIRGVLFDLLLSPDQPRQIILVDAVQFEGRKPGEVFEIDVNSVPAARISDFSPHQFPTVNMLKEIRDYTSIDVRVFVVQVEDLPDEVRPGLSRAVEEAVPEMCRMILKTLTGSSP